MSNENSNEIKGTVRVGAEGGAKNGEKGRKNRKREGGGWRIEGGQTEIPDDQGQMTKEIPMTRHQMKAPVSGPAEREVSGVPGSDFGAEQKETNSKAVEDSRSPKPGGNLFPQGVFDENVEPRTSNAEHRREDGKAPLPGPPPAPASRGEGDDCAAVGLTRVEPSSAVAGSGRNGETSEPSHVGCYEEEVETGRVKFREYQKAVFQDHSSGIVVLHWSRQIGKSYVLAAWAVCRLLIRPGRLVTVLSNSRENGAEFLLKCAEVCEQNGTRFETVEMTHPPLEYEDMRMELRIPYKGRMGRIKVLAANPRTARGFSGDLILDEFAFHEDGNAIWEAAEPILASNKDYLCRIASTGNGRGNLFYRMVEGDAAQSSNDQGPNSRECSIANHQVGMVMSNAECRMTNDQGEVSSSSAGPMEDRSVHPTPPRLRRTGCSVFSGEKSEGAKLEVVRPHPSPLPQEREMVSSASGCAESLDAVSAVARAGVKGEISEPSHVGCYVEDREGNPPRYLGGYVKSKAGFWVSRVTRSMAYEMGLEIYDSQTREKITPEQARAQALDKRAYDQNYECSFADEALALLSNELITAAECDDAGEICEQDWSASAWERMRQSTGQLYAGLDVGRKVDMSVLTVMEKTGGLCWIRGMLRMRDMRLPDQEARLGKLRKLRQLKLVCIDMTGLGLGLFEYAQRHIGEHWICGINFSSSVSATRVIVEEGTRRATVRVPEALAMEVLQAYEDRKIRQPRDWDLREDLRKPCRVTTPGGRVSIAAVRDSSGHADHFWSIALALEAAGGARVPFAFVPLKLRSRQPGILI